MNYGIILVFFRIAFWVEKYLRQNIISTKIFIAKRQHINASKRDGADIKIEKNDE